MIITLYRADDYQNNMGELLGFFDNIEDAKSELEFNQPAKSANGTFSQITEFEVLTLNFDKGEISDRDFMLNLWGEGEIVNDYYFVK